MKSKMNKSKKRMKNKKGKRKSARTYGGDEKADANAKAEESMKKVEQLKEQIKEAEKKAKEYEKKAKIIDERKITDININFYKSNFENTNPFPYYEQVVLNRSGQGVIGDLYGVEELFPTFKGELDFIIDKDKRDIFNPPFKRKNIKIEHTKNDKSAPTVNIFE